jgi:hypothetical protein
VKREKPILSLVARSEMRGEGWSPRDNQRNNGVGTPAIEVESTVFQ